MSIWHWFNFVIFYILLFGYRLIQTTSCWVNSADSFQSVTVQVHYNSTYIGNCTNPKWLSCGAWLCCFASVVRRRCFHHCICYQFPRHVVHNGVVGKERPCDTALREDKWPARVRRLTTVEDFLTTMTSREIRDDLAKLYLYCRTGKWMMIFTYKIKASVREKCTKLHSNFLKKCRLRCVIW